MRIICHPHIVLFYSKKNSGYEFIVCSTILLCTLYADKKLSAYTPHADNHSDYIRLGKLDLQIFQIFCTFFTLESGLCVILSANYEQEPEKHFSGFTCPQKISKNS